MSVWLTTSRLILRPVSIEDATALQHHANDWGVASMVTAIAHPYSREDALNFITQIIPRAVGDGDVILAIARVGTPEHLIGCIGCRKTGEDDLADLGYWLGRAFWGQGFMSEAVAALIGYLFDIWDVDILGAGYFCDNPASGRVLEKMGFSDHGPETYACQARDGQVDGRLMRLSRVQWKMRATVERQMK